MSSSRENGPRLFIQTYCDKSPNHSGDQSLVPEFQLSPSSSRYNCHLSRLVIPCPGDEEKLLFSPSLGRAPLLARRWVAGGCHLMVLEVGLQHRRPEEPNIIELLWKIMSERRLLKAGWVGTQKMVGIRILPRGWSARMNWFVSTLRGAKCSCQLPGVVSWALS